MYYDVSSSNTLQDKIKFVVFTIYFIYSASSIKGKRDYNNSKINQSFLRSSVHAYMQGREITH